MHERVRRGGWGRWRAASPWVRIRGMAPAALRCEPLRSTFERSTARSVLKAVFPLLTWSEELRLDLVFTGFALYYLLVQFINIYRFNLFNFNVEALLLGGIVLSKRCIAALGCGVWDEVTVRFPKLAKAVGASPASEQAIETMGNGRATATVLKAGLLGPGLVISTVLLLRRLSASSSAGPLQAGSYVFVVLFDFLLLFALDDPRTRAAKLGVCARARARVCVCVGSSLPYPFPHQSSSSRGRRSRPPRRHRRRQRRRGAVCGGRRGLQLHRGGAGRGAGPDTQRGQHRL